MGRHPARMIAMRAVLVGLGVLLGVVLIANGNVVIGGLVLVMACVRAVMVFRWHHRRQAFLERRAAFRARRRDRFS